MKHLNYLVLATLPGMIRVWANGCGLELDVGAVE
jgi:hypothetical protein